MDINLIGTIVVIVFIFVNMLVTLFLLREVRLLADRQDMVWQELVAIKQTTSDTHQIMLQLYRYMGLSSTGNKGT